MKRKSVFDDSGTKVEVVNPAREKFLILRWIDPKTGKKHQKSSKTKRRREAERMAAQLALEIDEGIYLEEHGWREFTKVYSSDHLPSLKKKSRDNWRTCRNWLEKLINPDTLQDLDAAAIQRFAAKLRQQGQGETTISTYLALLRAALGWAELVGMIDEVPRFRMPKRAKGRSKMARSRPIVEEELEKLLMVTKTERPKDAHRFRRLLNGLWESGFRISELLMLSWEAGQPWSIDTSGEFPCIRILSTGEKAHTDRFQPITPEFWALISDTAEQDRTGYVFYIPGRKGRQMSEKRVCRIISDIGRRTGVVTSAADGKCATSTDIGRRAFTTRLGKTLSQSELAEWMRHKSPKTTMNYYHIPNTMQLASRVWEKSGSTGGSSESEENSQSKR